MNMYCKRYIITVFTCFFFIFGYAVSATTSPKAVKVPDELNPGLVHILDLVSPPQNASPDMSMIGTILDFITAEKAAPSLFYSEPISGVPSAYYEFDLQSDLEKILRYAYNPDIPSVVFSPSSIRLSHWSEVNGQKQPLPKLWEHLDNLTHPMMVTGIERIENTPDLFSGAYFGYDLYRTLILATYKGKRVFLSLSRQKNVSEVGKKGMVLGEDEEWNYLYSGKYGMNKAGLGWVRPYIYESYSISAYVEMDEGRSLSRCGIFKWIRAGWAGINMVNRNHIYTGIERFATSFKQIVENPQLPNPNRLAGSLSKLSTIPTTTLKRLTQAQLDELKIQYEEVRGVKGLLKDHAYVERLSRIEMESMVAKEYIKNVLTNGKNDELLIFLDNPEDTPKGEAGPFK
ncbi:MAG: hypothetical protein HKM93_22765 [Desulfobacteraceae bacterium]|nr:hypothetical protein [Desulfobacteraceae bacterium]